MLLIISNKLDLTTDYLCLELNRRGIQFLRLNTEDYFDGIDIDIFLNNMNSSSIRYKDRKINIEEIKGVYFRRPKLPCLKDLIVDEEIEFIEREIETLISGMCRIIDDSKWLNHPKNLFKANNKIEQLNVAKNLGFSVPNTVITKNKNILKNFLETEKNIIGKAIKNGFYGFDNYVKIAFTQDITSSDVENIEQFADVPMIYQEKLIKKYDIRITVVDEKVFPAAIYSQEHSISKTDWRVWDVCEKFDLKHGKITLPKKIEELAIEITKYFDLKFSAIDMVLTQNGDYVFLELNPNGQWAWIEEKVGFPIRSEIIEFFERR